MAVRFDREISSSKIRKTAQGFIRVDARLTRTGVLEYKRADGSVVRELRLPNEVFKEDSLRSMEGAPVTDLHRGLVVPQNVGQLAVGHVAYNVKPDGKYVAGELVIQRHDAIDAISRRERVELSPGYTCDIEETPGVWEGQRYDAIQRNIVYNHVAILPRGQGRSGSEVAMRLDGKDPDEAQYNSEIDKGETLADKEREIALRKVKIVLDGITYEVEVPDALAPSLEAGVAKLDSKLSEVEKLRGELVATKVEYDKLKARFDAETSAVEVQKRVDARLSLIESVKSVTKEVDTKKSDRELKMDALVACGHDVVALKDLPDSFIDGAFYSCVALAQKEAAKPKSVGVAIPSVKTDSKEDKYDAEAARRRMIERNKTLWNKEAN